MNDPEGTPLMTHESAILVPRTSWFRGPQAHPSSVLCLVGAPRASRLAHPSGKLQIANTVQKL
jgi:hypothetical protein